MPRLGCRHLRGTGRPIEDSNYFFVVIARSPSLRNAGPTVITNSGGRMKSASGNRILMGSLRAASSARWRRFVRSRSACVRSVFAILAPSRSLWMTRATSAFSSSEPFRWLSAPERVRAGAPVAELEGHLRELGAHDVRDRRALLAHPGDGRVEPEPRLPSETIPDRRQHPCEESRATLGVWCEFPWHLANPPPSEWRTARAAAPQPRRRDVLGRATGRWSPIPVR